MHRIAPLGYRNIRTSEPFQAILLERHIYIWLDKVRLFVHKICCIFYMGWQTSGSTMNFEAVCRTRNPFAFKSTLSFDGEDRKERRKGTTPEKKREDAPFFLSSFPKPELVFNLCALCERKTKVGSPEKTIAGHILTQILNGLQCSCPIRLTDAMRSKYTKVKSVSVVKVMLQCSKCLSSIHDLRKQE